MRGNVVLGLLAGTTASAERIGRRDGNDLVHPFAKFKSIAMAAAPAVTSTTTTAAPTTTPPLECFQVAEPVLTPSGLSRRDISSPPTAVAGAVDQKPIAINVDVETKSSSVCAVVLMEHDFSNSYGAPFVGNYTPPDCDFDRVVINFTTVVAGRQYDRTGVMYLGDYEVWRTSTAEPTSYGIRWEWLKDMSAFYALWKEPQTVIFDLENIVTDVYTGILNTTLTATFFQSSDLLQSNADPGYYDPADVIIPISQLLGSQGQPSQFIYPDQNVTNTIGNFPRNANRAVFTLDVKGQGNEEFWWSNIPQSDIFAFNDTYGQYPGYSPFREVQAYVDDYLAGVYWPFPVIYTGGIVPELNRPIVGVQTFDILEHEIDITPFLPLLCDGEEHTFTIKIVGLDDNGKDSASLSNTTTEEWYVTGKVFVWVDDDASSITTGTLGDLKIEAPTISFAQTIQQNATGANETIDFTLSVSRTISLTSQVKTANSSGAATWTQKLSYSNVGGIYGYGYDNINTFLISGVESATGPANSFKYDTSYAFPLYSNSTYNIAPQGNVSIWADVHQGFQSTISGDAVLPTGLEGYVAVDGSVISKVGVGSKTSTWRNGTASYNAPGDNSYSTGAGETRQVFSFGAVLPVGGVYIPLYERDVSAANNSVTADRVTGVGVKPVVYVG
ncbi:peptide N-acetyl-beta-D-glucosaminyl asparaginase amidase A-domain-containing protein [Xylariaceae sp. FL0255]|nr:peptide N-acetyl-beta-D-glucosaminyl asparaginase amidase A-domain-containing protein [Xylariaceae sp. FL0255]